MTADTTELPVPDNLKNAAIAQLISGLINMFIMPVLGYLVIGTVCAVLTFFIGGCGGIFGCLTLFLWPIGVCEVLAGIFGLVNPKQGAPIMRIVSFLEIASILAGGIISAIVGFVVISMMRSNDVVEFMEA